MWWTDPLLRGHRSVYPDAGLLEVIARAFAIVEVGGLRGIGPERGRAFERVFYALCDRRGIRLTERAGARSVAGQRSASGLAHEVDCASRTASCITHWELKHLSGELPKNELVIFNGKGLDFLLGSDALCARTPTYRFLLSGGTMRDECRLYAVLWGIAVIEPGRLPLPLLCEAVARGGAEALRPAEAEVVQYRARWACRELQVVIGELNSWLTGAPAVRHVGPSVATRGRAILDVQEQLGAAVLDWLDDRSPDWLQELAEDTWRTVGGW